MAHAPSRPTKLSATDIARYTDAELDQYLETNQRCVDVDDPENLPEYFIQRLRARTCAVESSQPRSVDLNYVSARLNKVVSNRSTSPRSPSPATTIVMDEEEHDQYCREREKEFYNKLISDGGRPSHPLSLECNIAKNLPEYRDIILFWQFGTDNCEGWTVFGSQLGSWQQFREHQRLARGSDFPTFCQRQYDRLNRYGFQRPFKLDEQPDRQDKLTTWLEFLSYEYWKHDKSMDIVTDQQSRYDKAWKKLLDSKVLKPLETAEVLDHLLMLQLEREKISAENALESAMFYLNSTSKGLTDAQTSKSSSLDLEEHDLATPNSSIAAARKLLEQSSCRYELIGDFIDQTKSYRVAKRNANHSRLLLSWISNQIPLIELESNPLKRKPKRKLSTDHNNQPALKRRKQEVEPVVSQENRSMYPAALPSANLLNPKAGVEEACVVPSDERVKKRRSHSKLSLDGIVKVLRRSTRLKRIFERSR